MAIKPTYEELEQRVKQLEHECVRLKQTDEALRKSEEKYLNLLENLNEIVYALNDKAVITYVSRGVLEFGGYGRDELIGKTYIDFVHPDDKQGRIEQFQKILSGVNEPSEYRFLRKDGTPVWIRTNAKAVFKDGHVIGIQGTLVDITERKRAEGALHESESLLARSEEIAHVGSWKLDLIANRLICSDGAYRIFGCKPQEFAATYEAFLDFVHPDDRTAVDDAYSGSLRERGDGYEIKHRIIRKDTGEIRHVHERCEHERDASGAVIRSIGMVQDITERKQAEEEKEMLQAQLTQSQKMEAIGTLAGGIAHNFNNVLMGIQGRTSLIMMDMDPDHSSYEHLHEITQYVRRASDLTRDLLGFARGGKYEVKPADLNSLLRNENRMFRSTAKELQIHEKYEPVLWAVEVDQNQIRQALLNLYVNAWQAMPDGGDLCIQTENVTLDEEDIKPFQVAPGRYVKISVTDSGIGMDDATRGKIFDPFFTTKQTEQCSGLGLASVYGIIKNHGGFINVYSEKKVGTAFNIYLPATEKEVVVESSGAGRHDDIQYGQGIILLVDDEEMIIEVARKGLERLGYRVLVARSGREALDIYGKQKDEIDLVILDMIMPGLGGGESYDRLKAMDGQVKVLLSSGYSLNGQARAILERGCGGFIQKPFSLTELSRKVKEVISL